MISAEGYDNLQYLVEGAGLKCDLFANLQVVSEEEKSRIQSTASHEEVLTTTLSKIETGGASVVPLGDRDGGFMALSTVPVQGVPIQEGDQTCQSSIGKTVSWVRASGRLGPRFESAG